MAKFVNYQSLCYCSITVGKFIIVEYAEADTYFCFQNLMGDIRDNFIRSMDNSQDGIGKLHQFIDFLNMYQLEKFQQRQE